MLVMVNIIIALILKDAIIRIMQVAVAESRGMVFVQIAIRG